MRRIIKLKHFNSYRHRLFIFASIFVIVVTILIVSLTTSRGISSHDGDEDDNNDADHDDKKVHHRFKLPENARHYNRTVKPHGRKWRNHANYTSPIEVYYVGSFDQLITKDNPIQIIIVDNGKDNNKSATPVGIPALFDILFNETFNTLTCSGAVMANIRWQMAESYYIDTRGPHCMSDSFIQCTFIQAFSMWQTFMNFDPFASNPILEPTNGILYNNRNEVQFGSIDINGHTNSIALTSVWWDGTQFVEWDQIYNTMYNYGDAEKDSTKMDLARISTHEFGHVLGLIDIYDSACIPYTIMYGYASYGEYTNRMPKLVDINALTNLGYSTSTYGSRVYNVCPGYNDKCVKTVPKTNITTTTTTIRPTTTTTTTTKSTTKATTKATTMPTTTTTTTKTTTKSTTVIPVTTKSTTRPVTTTKSTTRPVTTTKSTTTTTTTTTTKRTIPTNKPTIKNIFTKPSTSSTTTKKITTIIVPTK